MVPPGKEPAKSGGKAESKGKKKSEEPKEAKDNDKNEKDKDKDKGKDDKKDEKEKLKEFRIALDGIAGRIVALPIEPAVINTYLASKGFIFYSTTPIQGLSDRSPRIPAIHVYDLKERKDRF